MSTTFRMRLLRKGRPWYGTKEEAVTVLPDKDAKGRLVFSADFRAPNNRCLQPDAIRVTLGGHFFTEHPIPPTSTLIYSSPFMPTTLRINWPVTFT
jgi:hypothetical protein